MDSKYEALNIMGFDGHINDKERAFWDSVIENGGIGGVTDVGGAEVTATGATTAISVEDKFAERVSVTDFGAVGDGTTDDITAFQAAVTAAGVNGYVEIPAGTYHLSDAWYLDQRGQVIQSNGAIIDNTVVREAQAVSIKGRLNIIYDQITGKRPWWGLVNYRGQDGASDDVIYIDGAPLGVVLSGSRGGQVAGLHSINITERCGIPWVCSASATGTCIHQLPSRAFTSWTVLNQGTGYNDGQWIVPATGGTGVGIMLGLWVSGGVVQEVQFLDGGNLYSLNDTLSFNIADARDRDDNVMTTGSGFSVRIDELLEDNILSFCNDCTFVVTGREGWAGGCSTWGANYNKIYPYLEALTTVGKPYLRGQFSTLNIISPTILVNGALNNPGVGVPMVDFSSTYGASTGLSMSSGRIANVEVTYDTAEGSVFKQLVKLPDSHSTILNTTVSTSDASTFGFNKFQSIEANSLSVVGYHSKVNPALLSRALGTGNLNNHTVTLDLGTPLTPTSAMVRGKIYINTQDAFTGGTYQKTSMIEVAFTANRNTAGTASHIEWQTVVAQGATVNDVTINSSSKVITVDFDTTDTINTNADFVILAAEAFDIAGTNPSEW